MSDEDDGESCMCRECNWCERRFHPNQTPADPATICPTCWRQEVSGSGDGSSENSRPVRRTSEEVTG